MEDSTISPLASFIMPIGNLDGDFANISMNISNFANVYDSELILVIDSAPTRQLEIFLESGRTLKNVKIFTGQFGNPGSPRNVGMANALGKWLAFIDSDDTTDFTSFIEMIDEAEKLNKDLVIGNFLVEENGKQSQPDQLQDHPEDVNEFIARNPGIWRMGFRHKAILGTQFPEYRMGEDQVFLARLGFWNIPVHISSKLVYTYRKNFDGQLTSNKAAICDLSRAQDDTLGALMTNRDSPKDSNILSIMLTNQMISSVRRLGVSGVNISLRNLYKSTDGMKTFGTLFLLLGTLYSEIILKIRTLRVSKE